MQEPVCIEARDVRAPTSGNDNRELGWGLGETMALADVMIINESSLDEFKDNVRKLMEEFRR